MRWKFYSYQEFSKAEDITMDRIFVRTPQLYVKTLILNTVVALGDGACCVALPSDWRIPSRKETPEDSGSKRNLQIAGSP